VVRKSRASWRITSLQRRVTQMAAPSASFTTRRLWPWSITRYGYAWPFAAARDALMATGKASRLPGGEYQRAVFTHLWQAQSIAAAGECGDGARPITSLMLVIERTLGPRCANSRGVRRLAPTIGRIYVCDLTDDRPARALLVGSGVHIHPVSAKRMWAAGGLLCPLRLCLFCRCVERRRRTDKLLECAGIYFRAVLNIDGASHVAVQT